MFKRNQVEEAIASVLQPGSTKLDPRMSSRVRRLLVVDRDRGRQKRSSDPEKANFAFYSAEGPGRGYENQFSAYEAFALLTGLHLMGHGWPQQFAVGVLRRLRPELERQHARILRQAPSVLFNERQMVVEAKPGDMAFGNVNPMFIVIVSEQGHNNRSPLSSVAASGVVRAVSPVRTWLRVYAIRTGELRPYAGCRLSRNPAAAARSRRRLVQTEHAPHGETIE